MLAELQQQSPSYPGGSSTAALCSAEPWHPKPSVPWLETPDSVSNPLRSLPACSTSVYKSHFDLDGETLLAPTLQVRERRTPAAGILLVRRAAGRQMPTALHPSQKLTSWTDRTTPGERNLLHHHHRRVWEEREFK